MNPLRQTGFWVAVFAIVVLALCYWLYRQNQSLRQSIQRRDSIISEKDAVIQYIRTESDKWKSQKEAAVATTQEIARAYPKVVEEIRKEFDLKMKDVKSYMRNEFAAHGQGNATIHNHYGVDSSGVRRSSWELKVSDGYLDFRANIIDSLNAPYQYTYGDTATTVIHGHKRWFGGNEKLYSSTVFRNPNSRITGTTNILVDNYRDKRWVITLGITWLPLQMDQKITDQIQPGVSVGYGLFKF